jgi:integrase
MSEGGVMPPRPPGVYQDSRGKWYFKVTVGQDPLTGKRDQVTRRGFATMAEASKERREVLNQIDRGQRAPSSAGLKVNEILDLYLDGIDADKNLALKTRFDYRQYAEDYIRPYIGDRRVRDITPEVILAWQRKLLKEGGAKKKKGKGGKPGAGKPLSPNTVNRIRAPLSATFKLAVQAGMIPINPLLQAPRPKPQRKIPKYWSPEEARKFLALMEGDRTWPIWAFLLGSGVRIGELVSLRWPSVDLKNRRVRIMDFVSTLGYDMMPSRGKSRDSIRTIDLDDGLADVLRQQKVLQKTERVAAKEWIESDFVFTRPDGGQYHPMNLSRLLSTYTTELDVPRLTAHGLRHTSATLMLASGVPPKVAAERLGHADATLFTNLYSHVTPTMQREAAEKIGNLLFGDDS